MATHAELCEFKTRLVYKDTVPRQTEWLHSETLSGKQKQKQKKVFSLQPCWI